MTNICSVRFGPVDVAIYSVPLEFADIDAKRAWIRRQHFQECGLEAGGTAGQAQGESPEHHDGEHRSTKRFESHDAVSCQAPGTSDRCPARCSGVQTSDSGLLCVDTLPCGQTRESHG